MIWVRFVHVTAAVFWAGAGLIMGYFVVPASRQVGPASAPVVQAILKRRLPELASLASVLTVGAGIWLWANRGMVFADWRAWALGIGALAGLTAAVFGVGWQRPTAQKLARLGEQVAGSGRPPGPTEAAELEALSARLARYANYVAILLSVALLGMALGA